MAEKNSRTFTTKLGAFTARIFPEKLDQSDEGTSAIHKSDRKFNIRIKQDDVILLDAIADYNKANNLPQPTRSALINELLHEIARDELMSVEDLDARVLLACEADESATYDSLAHPWVYDALDTEFHTILGNVRRGDDAMTGQPVEMRFPSGYKYTEEEFRSPAYLGLREKMKGAKK